MNYLHLMKKVAIAILCVLSVANAQDKRFAFKGNAAQAGSSFVWHVTDSAEVSDSLRFIQGSNITLTQSGNTLTIAGAAGAGSTANVRANTGWTASGTLARDTLYTNYAIFGAKTFGVGGTTQAQNARAKFNVLGRASADTLAIFSNDGGGVVGDSTVMIDHAGRIGIKTAPSASYSLTNLNGMLSGWYDASIGSSGNANTLVSLQNSGSGAGTGATINIDGTVIRGIERSSVVDLELVAGTNGRVSLIPGASGSIMIGQGAASTTSQAFVTIRTQTPTADTTFMVRNNKASGTDSTVYFTATGDIDAGGNNFYLGGHRIRSNAAGDSLIFYDGNTMIFAILSDGTTADLVETTLFWTFFDKFRNEVLFWILAVAGILACILALLSIYAKVRML